MKAGSKNTAVLVISIVISLVVLCVGALAIWNRLVEREFSETLDSAKNGDTESQFIVGMMYEFGTGTNTDLSEAGRWYMQAAENGYKDAELFICAEDESGRQRYKITEEAIHKLCN